MKLIDWEALRRERLLNLRPFGWNPRTHEWPGINPSEAEWARSAGERAGRTFDAPYDSTPPSCIKDRGVYTQEACARWREFYRQGWETGRRSRGVA